MAFFRPLGRRNFFHSPMNIKALHFFSSKATVLITFYYSDLSVYMLSFLE